MAEKMIPASKVETYVASTVDDFRERLNAQTRAAQVREARIREANASAEKAGIPLSVAPEVTPVSGLPTDAVEFPTLQVVVDMQTLVNRERFAA